MARWIDDIVQAMKNLGGRAEYKDLYDEVRRIREDPLPSTWKAVVRNQVESHSSDSDNYTNGRKDYFYSVHGKGKGVWALRPQYLSDDVSSDTRIFGHIPGYPPGSHFESRAHLSEASVHRPTQAGISGSEMEGADSIVLSGGYEDDEDFGSEIVYTGHGGRDLNTGQQIAHQALSRGNLALAKSKVHGLPVRVIRGYGDPSPYSPSEGYRYDGLYHVDDYWKERGSSGYNIWRFRLVKNIDSDTEDPSEYIQPDRQEVTTSRRIRNPELVRKVKELYDYQCQICGIRLEGSAGPYAEAAHIRPLGRPHNGPDTLHNMLCLCPNHHVLLDFDAFSIADDYSLIGLEGKVDLHPKHRLHLNNIRYHREQYILSQDNES